MTDPGAAYRRRVRATGTGVALVAALSLIAGPAAADGPGYKFFRSGGSPKKPGAYWDPCSPVTYGIDFTYAKRKGLRAAREEARWRSAVAEVATTMGMKFRYQGRIKSRARGARPRSASGVDLIITYGNDTRGGRYGYGRTLAGSVAGVAGISWRRVSRVAQVTSGYVVIDAKDVVRNTDATRAAFDPRPAAQRSPDVARALYMHEFGHAVGLDHVRDRRQLMYPQLQTDRPDTLGAGDRRGLRKLGIQRCF